MVGEDEGHDCAGHARESDLTIEREGLQVGIGWTRGHSTINRTVGVDDRMFRDDRQRRL